MQEGDRNSPSSQKIARNERNAQTHDEVHIKIHSMESVLHERKSTLGTETKKAKTWSMERNCVSDRQCPNDQRKVERLEWSSKGVSLTPSKDVESSGKAMDDLVLAQRQRKAQQSTNEPTWIGKCAPKSREIAKRSRQLWNVTLG